MTLTYKPARAYEHIQADASDTWVIVHNLQLYPVVDIFIDYNGELQKIIPMSVEYTDTNTCTVTFSSPYTGLATVV
jgi:hypothetical protein